MIHWKGVNSLDLHAQALKVHHSQDTCHLHKPSSETIAIDLAKRAWKSAYFESSLFIIHETWVLMTLKLGGALVYRLANSVIDRIITSQSCWRFGWPDYGEVACDPYYLGYVLSDWSLNLTCERHESDFCMWPFKITELEKGRRSWISNCGEAFHTDSWLAEVNPGHSDPDAILQALLPGPSTVVLFGPGKARMDSCQQAQKFIRPQPSKSSSTHVRPQRLL